MTILETLAAAGLLMILGTWIGYPLLVWLLSRVRRRPVGNPPAVAPRVSVVIASREPADAIRARVDNCLAQQYDRERLDVIVALDAEAKTSAEDLGGIDRVRVVRGAVAGKAAALNAGVAAATGDCVVFADTYQRFEPEAVSRLVATLATDGIGAASGRLRIPAGRALLARLYWRYETWLRQSEARLHSCVGATGAILAIRRELWQPLPEDLLLDDVYTPMNIVLHGQRVAFVAEAEAVELRTSAPENEYLRKVRTLTGVLQVCSLLPAVLVPWKNPLWIQFVIHKLLRMVTPLALLPLFAWLVFAALALPPERLAAAAVVGLGGAGWLLRSGHRRARQMRDLIVEGTLLQAAIVVAGVNGLRGRWKVWNG